MHQNYIKYNAETPPKYPQSSTGKERDSETGFSYFGARYYDSDILTSWLSVDPMADKYPGLSPYAYCGWNPVRLVDPDGREIDWVENIEGKIYWDETAVSQATTKKGEKYLGKEGYAIDESTGKYEHYKSDGTIETFTVSIEPISIISEKESSNSSEILAKIPSVLTLSLYDGPQLGPADVVALAGVSIIATTAIVYELGDLFSSSSQTDKSDLTKNAEHTKGARTSTWDKHTKKRSGELTGQERNNKRGNKNKKHVDKPNPNKKK